MTYFLLFFGIVILVIGGELLVQSAISLNNKFKLSPLLIGTTVVSFGTSAPELIVSVQAMLNGNSSVAVGNVVGSNIANLGLVLGFVILLKPLTINWRKYLLSYLIMFFSAALFWVFSHYVKLDKFEGIFLLFGLMVFLFLSIRYMKMLYKKDRSLVRDERTPELKIKLSTKWMLIYFVLGSIGLALGSELLVQNAVLLATEFGVSEFVIGLSIVALGTSLPELITSLVAIYKGENSISIGNLIGSNIFNVFAVIGTSSLIGDMPVSQDVFDFDLIVMLLFVLFAGYLIFIMKKMSRIHGVILLITYVLYIVYSMSN
jgi:cation:H+ antiporter